MRLASIDIGTNSVKLLIADFQNGNINNVLIERPIITRLGQGVNETGELTTEAMSRTLKVLGDFKAECESLGVQKIVAVATSAMRDASNRDIFLQDFADQIGVSLQIASGDEEAELTFIGTCSDPALRSKKLLLVDVGGGSSEFISGENGIIENRFSINTGCVRLTEEFLRSDPVDSLELQKAFQKLIPLLYGHLSKIYMEDRELVGVGGTITTLAAIHQELDEYNSNSIQGYVLQKEDIVRLLTYLKRMTLEERRKVKGLPPQRADVIVAGAAIFSTIMEILKSREIIISTRGLRYGALLKAEK